MIKGFHIVENRIVTSDGCVGDTLDFLMENASEINGFYHLNYNVACLARMLKLSKEQCALLLKKGLTLGKYKIKYAPGKYLKINGVIFADMYQYHEEELWRQNPDENPSLAMYAQTIGEEVYGALCDCGLHPQTLTSPIRAYQNEVLARCDIPTVDDMPAEAGQMAYECCKGNWLECYKIGHFEKVWDYDLTSAYPAEIYNLLDIRKGYWVRSKEYVPDAVYGFARGTIEVDADISPMLYAKGKVRGERQNYTPKGTWPDTLTKQQIDYLTEYGGSFEIKDGAWWIPEGRQNRPYQRIIEHLFDLKEKATGLRRTVIKRIPNGLYGKQLEILDDKMGDLFNPVYGAVTETNVRLKDARFIKSHNLDKNLIHVAVDGLLLDTEVKHGLSNTLGGWRQTHSGSAYVVGAGAVAIQGKEGHGDFSLRYDWLQDQIQENPQASDYSMTKLTPVTIGMALHQNKFDQLGTLQNTSRSIGLNFEGKRFFPKMPGCGQDLKDNIYESLPLDILMC